jgi:hypothetical protein
MLNYKKKKKKKYSSHKSGLGFDKFATSLSHDASTFRTVFVKPEIFEPHVACLDKGKNVIVYEHVKIEFEILVQKQSKSKFIRSQNPWTKNNDPKKGKAGTKPSMSKLCPSS